MAHMKPMDIRIIKSKALLLDALIELMKEKPYHDISIKELAEEACVSRQTFYRNFTDKDDILLQYMDEVFNGFFLSVKNKLHRQESISDMSMNILEVWKDNKNIFFALQKAGLMHKTLERFSQYALMLHRHFGKITGKKSTQHSYIAQFIAGGTYMVLSKWFQENMKVPAGEMGKFFTEIGKFAFDLAMRDY